MNVQVCGGEHACACMSVHVSDVWASECAGVQVYEHVYMWCIAWTCRYECRYVPVNSAHVRMSCAGVCKCSHVNIHVYL